VFNDADGNGTRDPGEGGAVNTDVFLDLNGDGKFDSGDRITRTDANGAYSFNGLLPGDYRVMELVNPPHAVTSPSNNLHLVNLAEGQRVTGQDFGDVTDPQIVSIVGQSLAQAHGSTPQFDQDHHQCAGRQYSSERKRADRLPRRCAGLGVSYGDAQGRTDALEP
jgi:hypothetical protein